MTLSAITAETSFSTQATESHIRDFVALLKPRVMSLVVFSGLTGLLIAPGNIHPFIGFIAIFCIALGSGASGAINMWYDRDIDRIMKRTLNRPIPAGRMAPAEALALGVVMALVSVIVMALAVNMMAGALLLAAILFYVFIYTVGLKRRTPQNIVIGGAAGSFPPMIGWAAVTGQVSLEGILLFMIIFMWTPPHFWALALFRSEDYAKAGIPMLPVVRGEQSTRNHILIYTLLLLPLTLLPNVLGMAGLIYSVSALVLGGYFLWDAFIVYRGIGDQVKAAKKLFGYSILYLFLLYTALIVDHYLFIPLMR